ncbi:MAG: type II toxin-antitoxin system YafQ family toxin [Oscillospiraceae bacterium]|nr:type II toxin-antitoxin system YafQ family toxin [Oscillospiraceae bacterium]
MYKLIQTNSFKKDLKTIIRRGYNIKFINDVVDILQKGDVLPENFKDHNLIGNWKGYRECHITPDWLLIYKIDNDSLILTLTRTGTHSDLF